MESSVAGERWMIREGEGERKGVVRRRETDKEEQQRGRSKVFKVNKEGIEERN